MRQIVLSLACIGLASSAEAQATAASSAPARIAVIGSDYAFMQFPTTIPAGATLFSFENRGRVKHEMSMTLLQPGVTLDQLRDRPPGAPSSRAVSRSLVGILIARAGESAGGQLFVNLESGQRYLVVCTLKDAPDARPHAELGMVTTFDVP